MNTLDLKQQQLEEDILHQSSTVSSLGLPPATPMRTPVHAEARSRANTATHITPVVKNAFESLSSMNEQLVTPPSEKHMRLGVPKSTTRSVPSSRKPSIGGGLHRSSGYNYFHVVDGFEDTSRVANCQPHHILSQG